MDMNKALKELSDKSTERIKLQSKEQLPGHGIINDNQIHFCQDRVFHCVIFHSVCQRRYELAFGVFLLVCVFRLDRVFQPFDPLVPGPGLLPLIGAGQSTDLNVRRPGVGF